MEGLFAPKATSWIVERVMVNILMIGDVFGRPGREILAGMLPSLRKRLAADLVVANCENASGGIGLSAASAQEVFLAGVEVITTGNHVWRHRDLLPLLDQEPHLLRPHNYPAAPGRGWVIAQAKSGAKVAVVNLQGRTYLSPIDCPFRTADALLDGALKDVPLVLVDMHAEATSEKQALARYLDGRVSAVLGSHTHVQTSDAYILPGGTAYLSDLGMCGPAESVIGMDPQVAIDRFLSQRPQRFSVAPGPVKLEGALVSLDPASGKAIEIRTLREQPQAD